MSAKSDDGFYWVRPKEWPRKWTIAELKDGSVWLIGIDAWWPRQDFEWGEQIRRNQ
jgi:hypothetical protein